MKKLIQNQEVSIAGNAGKPSISCMLKACFSGQSACSVYINLGRLATWRNHAFQGSTNS